MEGEASRITSWRVVRVARRHTDRRPRIRHVPRLRAGQPRPCRIQSPFDSAGVTEDAPPTRVPRLISDHRGGTCGISKELGASSRDA